MALDPRQWADVQDGRGRGGFVFRRGLALARECCGPHLRRGEVWADIGSGTGHLAAALSAEGVRVTGVDRSLPMTAYAARRWPGPSFIAADAQSLPYRSESLDGITAISLLGCLDGGGVLFSECARVLRAGGVLCVSVTNRHSVPLKLLGLGRRLSSITVERYAAYDPRAVCADLQAAGFTILRQRFYGRFGLPAEVTTSWEHDAEPGRRSCVASNALFLAKKQT
jgi:SAM-dependent methyltransferase